MTDTQKIFLGIILGLFTGVMIFLPAFIVAVDHNLNYSILYGVYIAAIVFSALVYDGTITFRKKITTTNNDWSDIDHLRWMFNRLKHVHKENENYDYMIRLKKIIDKLEKGGD